MDETEATKTQAYSRGQWVLAVNASVVLGWTLVNAVVLAGISGGGAVSLFAFLMYSALIGLPLAMAVGWFLIAPILKYAMHSSLSWLGAAGWGLAITSALLLVGLALGRYAGLDRSVASIPSEVLIAQAAMFLFGGVSIALIIRALVGPGSSP